MKIWLIFFNFHDYSGYILKDVIKFYWANTISVRFTEIIDITLITSVARQFLLCYFGSVLYAIYLYSI